jgi:hypothetical protein
MQTLVTARREEVIPLMRIVGPEPCGRCPERREQLITAVRLHQRPCFSFDKLRSLGDRFISSCLGPTLLFAARNGHPACATHLDPSLAAGLHAGLLEIGILLPDRDSSRVLGASEPIVAAHRALTTGAVASSALAAALGTSTLTASGYLRLFAHWGVGPAGNRQTLGNSLAIAV